MPVLHAVRLATDVEPYPGYRLRHRIGTGGFSEVWEAEPPNGRPVALKFVPCEDELHTKQELRALQAIRQLQHPHLVRTDRVWCHLGYIIIAMELAEGNLQDFLAVYQEEFGEAVPREHVCLLLAQAASALDYLNIRQHTVNDRPVAIQHCDVKPSNLLLFGDRVKVADFGLTSLLGSDWQPHRRAGTIAFAAPELFQGRLSPQSDQYALAVSYVLLRTGRLPFPDAPKTFHSDYVRPAPDLSGLALSERPLVAKALSREPSARWSSCGELMARLTRLRE